MTKNEIALDNAVDYSKWQDVKQCIRQLGRLQHTAEAGNMTAACIYADVISTFNKLSNRQRQCISLVMLQGYTIQETAVKLGITHQCVADYIKNACKRISFLLDGAENG